jgi:streptogramin lyase
MAAVAVSSALVACSTVSMPATRTADVPLQRGEQTTLVRDPVGLTTVAVDNNNVLYLAGAAGISTLAPGTAAPIPMNITGSPTVLAMAAAPDGTLYFAGTSGFVETLARGATTPQRLPFGKLQRFSGIAVARDGTVYLADNQRDKLLSLSRGATAPVEMPVTGIDGLGHMVIDADGNLFASMRGHIVTVAANATTPEPVAGAPAHVGGLAVDDAGNLYATDVKANTVSRMPAGGGDWERLPFSGLKSPTDITVDSLGNVYVITALGRQVLRLAVA